jgi:tetratricopeptide (TPR) repeat protein
MRSISASIFTILFLLACQPGQSPAQNKLRNEIQALESQVGKAKDFDKDRAVALQLVEKASLYAKQYPQDTLTPALLFRAGDAAKNVKEYGKAVELWGQVWRNYSKHPKAAMALYQQGFTFDRELQDPVMANKYYKKFLASFPNDSILVPQVKQLQSVLNVNPGMLIEKAEKYETE